MEQEHHSSVIYSCVLKMVKLITMMLVTWRQNKEKEKLLCLLTQTLSVRLCFKWHCTNMQRKQQQRQKIFLVLWFITGLLILISF